MICTILSREQSKHWEGVETRKMKAGDTFSACQKKMIEEDSRKFFTSMLSSLFGWQREKVLLFPSKKRQSQSCKFSNFFFFFNGKICIEVFQEVQSSRKTEKSCQKMVQEKREDVVKPFSPIHMNTYFFPHSIFLLLTPASQCLSFAQFCHGDS